jgi:hypothetical protein
MGNGVIIPPHYFEQPSRWYHRVWEGTKYEFGEVTYDIMSILSFIKILAGIIQLLNAHKRITQAKFKLGWMWLSLCCACAGDHAQWRHDYSTSRFQATVTLVLQSVVSYKVCVCSNLLWHKVRTEFHENPNRNYLVIACA